MQICGGGSGEYYGGANSGIYAGVNRTTGEIKEFLDFRAGHCIEKDNWVYYLDVINIDQKGLKTFRILERVKYMEWDTFIE